MEFINDSKYVASHYRAQLFYRDLTLVTVVAKCSFDVTEHGEVVPCEEQLAIVEEDTVSAYGVVDGDAVPIKEGCDVAVLGYALARNGRPATVMDVAVRLGGFNRVVRVFGDRAWVPTGNGVAISDPVPFEAMPMDFSRAFGGAAIHHDEVETHYADNPDGRGWALRPEHVPGTRLPNIEEVDQLITSWKDQPLPASLCPVPRRSAIRGARGITVDIEGERISYSPLAFCFSHPKMALPKYPAGEPAIVTGMNASGTWRFAMPEINLGIRVELGGQVHELGLVPDTVCLMPHHNKFYVTARRALVYQFVPERERRITLFEAASAVEDTKTLSSVAAEKRAGKSAKAVVEFVDPETIPLPPEMFEGMYPLTNIIQSLPLCISG